MKDDNPQLHYRKNLWGEGVKIIVWKFVKEF